MKSLKTSTAVAGLAAMTLLDISASTPVAAQGVNIFTGPYGGVHTGYFTSDANFTSAPYTAAGLGDTFAIPGRNETFDLDGALFGVHGGINFAVGPNFIAGLETDWSRLGENDTTSFSGTGTTGGGDGFAFQSRSTFEYEWQSTIRGRIGVVAGNVLFFGTAGVAFLSVDWSETAFIQEFGGGSNTTNHAKDKTLVGSVIGGGVEIALTPTIIFGTDYLYENFGSFDSVPHGFLGVQSGTMDDIDVHKIRARLSVKFGAPAP